MFRPPASVLIVSDSPKVTEYLTLLLPKDVFSPVAEVKSAGEAARLLVNTPYDLVIINTPLPDEFGLQLALECSERHGSGVLLLARAERYEQVCCKVEEYGILTLQRPTSGAFLLQALHLLLASQSRTKALTHKARTLEDRMSEIKLVNRAKLLLMTTLGMTEPAAHRYIEKQAMDTCTKRREIAANIIRTYQK